MIRMRRNLATLDVIALCPAESGVDIELVIWQHVHDQPRRSTDACPLRAKRCWASCGAASASMSGWRAAPPRWPGWAWRFGPPWRSIGSSSRPLRSAEPCSLLIAVVLAVVLLQLIGRRAFVRITDSNAAMVLERRFPQLGDSLLTAVRLPVHSEGRHSCLPEDGRMPPPDAESTRRCSPERAARPRPTSPTSI